MGKVKQGRVNNNNKVPKKPKNIRFCYRKEHVTLALQDVHAGKSIAETSRKYNIPESTIRAKVKGTYSDKKPGPSTVLTYEEEQELVDWIFECCRTGFPVSKSQLLESVKVICEHLNKKNPFTDNKPGRYWYEGFLKRHPQISERISENVSLNRAKVSESSLRIWFKRVSDYLTVIQLLNIEPYRIFNSNETAIPLNPKVSSLLAPKGHRNFFNILDNSEKENITVLITGNALGDIAPTLILFNGKSLADNAARMAPSEFSFGFSENGWMTSINYYDYIANIFEPWLTEQRIKRPVILYIDGHSSHMTLHLSKFCSNHQIILVALHPKATHIIQPLDVSLFQALKVEWQKTYKEFCEDSSSIGLHKYQFAPLLKKTFDSMNIKEILQNGFKKCGLFPFNVNSIDFNKVLCRYQNQSSSCSTNKDNDSGTAENEVDKLKVLESLLTVHQLESFRMNVSPIWKGIKEDKSLFDIWYKLTYPNANTILNQDTHVDSKISTNNESAKFGSNTIYKYVLTEVDSVNNFNAPAEYDDNMCKNSLAEMESMNSFMNTKVYE